jgi:hypothetical protein
MLEPVPVDQDDYSAFAVIAPDQHLTVCRVGRHDCRSGGIEVVADRVVWQGNHVSGAGVSAGIDMAFSLTERVHGRKLAESLQLVIEYDPQPPFDSGSPNKADASTLRLAVRLLLGDRPVQFATQVIAQASAARLRRIRPALSGSRSTTTTPASRS